MSKLAHDAASTVSAPFFRGKRCGLALGLLGISAIPDPSQAQGFLDDSHGTLTLRNYYMDRDYKDDGTRTATREWAQGFIMNAESGFTQGPVGFGLDARALVGVKLDSSPDRSGTELLPVSASDGRAADEYSRLALTGKLKFHETTLKTGDVSIFLPFAFASPSRLLPQTFRGTTLTSKDIDDLTLHAGYIDRVNKRDSSNYQPISIASPNRRFNGAATSSHMAYAGGDYQVNKDLSLRAYHAEVDDLYTQNTLALLHKLAIGDWRRRTDHRSAQLFQPRYRQRESRRSRQPEPVRVVRLQVGRAQRQPWLHAFQWRHGDALCLGHRADGAERDDHEL